jgi:hypothetical protein
MPSANISVYEVGSRTFAQTTACIEQRDAVVAADLGVANLSAMVGKLTVLSHTAACDWRWGVKGKASPWMQNCRVLRQTVEGAWRGVVDEAVAVLS